MSAAHPDTAPLLLALWERGAVLPPLERSLLLAEAAGRSRADLLQQPVGRTHRGVLDLRERLLGPELSATATCPACAERVEVALDARQFQEGDGPLAGEAFGVRWRAPTPADLLAVAGDADPLAALRARCLIGESTVEAEAILAAADPLAETMLDLRCPACGSGFTIDLDIGSFVWLEIEAAARRVLLQVDTLARAYGWTEAQVLALPPVRRAAYLRMAAGGVP